MAHVPGPMRVSFIGLMGLRISGSGGISGACEDDAADAERGASVSVAWSARAGFELVSGVAADAGADADVPAEAEDGRAESPEDRCRSTACCTSPSHACLMRASKSQSTRSKGRVGGREGIASHE